MSERHPNTQRIGGPGASHENRQQPEKSRYPRENPRDGKGPRFSDVSGGGGEKDAHHTHDPVRKGGM